MIKTVYRDIVSIVKVNLLFLTTGGLGLNPAWKIIFYTRTTYNISIVATKEALTMRSATEQLLTEQNVPCTCDLRITSKASLPPSHRGVLN